MWRADCACVWRKIAPWQYDALKELIAGALNDAEKRGVARYVAVLPEADVDALQNLIQRQSEWIEKIVDSADIEDDCQIIGLLYEVVEAGYKLVDERK